jgi:serine/threonine protein kinase
MQILERINGNGVNCFRDDEKERHKGLEDDAGSSAGPDYGQFDKTRWSMVLGAVQSRAPCAQKALAELCGLYWRPLYAFARRRGRSPEDAQDLVQGFFEHLIGSRGLATHGAFVGTPAFANPEQLRGAGVDIRSDLYSLGVIVWQIVAGKAPFRGSPLR